MKKLFVIILLALSVDVFSQQNQTQTLNSDSTFVFYNQSSRYPNNNFIFDELLNTDAFVCYGLIRNASGTYDTTLQTVRRLDTYTNVQTLTISGGRDVEVELLNPNIEVVLFKMTVVASGPLATREATVGTLPICYKRSRYPNF